MSQLLATMYGIAPTFKVIPKPRKIPNHEKHFLAVERYREVMGTEWATTIEIEARLGINRSCARNNLERWLKNGLVEKQKTKPAANWLLRDGFKWRFIK